MYTHRVAPLLHQCLEAPLTTDHFIPRHMRMPEPRGPLSEHVSEALASPVHRLAGHPEIRVHSMTDDDLHLALYLCYELHYTAIDDVNPGWEWEPSLLEFRRDMEDAFEKELTVTVSSFASEDEIASTVATLAESDSGCALGRYLEKNPSIERFKEFVAHRSAYQLKEANPHSWVIPRLGGRAKAALIEIQSDDRVRRRRHQTVVNKNSAHNTTVSRRIITPPCVV